MTGTAARHLERSVHGPFESITIRQRGQTMSYGVGIMGIMVGPQARKERVMRRLLRCGLALVLVMAALPTGDRTAHAADSILTEILRRGTVRIALVVVVPPLRFEDE